MIQKGNVINASVSDELDALRKIAFSGKDYLLEIQKREVERTGITSLKIAFNNVFGYYLEVTNVHKNKVPTDWMRKQTLTNAERYITPELKEYEEKILGAEEKIHAHEVRLFNELVVSVADYISPVQLNAALISRLDCLLCFATVSEQNLDNKVFENFMHLNMHFNVHFKNTFKTHINALLNACNMHFLNASSILREW